MESINNIDVRMYNLGTGDCFVLLFKHNEEVRFKMMIDGGAIFGTKKRLSPYIEDLKEYVDNSLDLLVITHEHQDHVLAFQACEELFTSNFKVKKIWMAWTENDESSKVKRWKKDYGEKKRALYEACNKIQHLTAKTSNFREQYLDEYKGDRKFKVFENFSKTLSHLTALHVPMNGRKTYKGLLQGMDVVKNKIAKNNEIEIEYLEQGTILENIGNALGIRFYVLGPPNDYQVLKDEHGGKGESYEHNKILKQSNSFSEAILNEYGGFENSVVPFDDNYIDTCTDSCQKNSYEDRSNIWRKIDNDWLFNSAGALALRMNSTTNNLSLVLAIEFIESGNVLLFPGDAEFGSWKSWHDIDWQQESAEGKHLTEDLLNRTVFYKVAHHLSHNGTTKRLGLDMMTNANLTAMATLDYSCIRPGWKKTMPNIGILEDLIKKTKGRLIVMNTKGVYYNEEDKILLEDKLIAERVKTGVQFDFGESDSHLYKQCTING